MKKLIERMNLVDMFKDWLKDKHNLTPAQYGELPIKKQQELQKEFEQSKEYKSKGR